MTMLDLAKERIPYLTEKSAEIEAARRLPSEVANELAKDGFFRLLTPSYLGGLEATPLEFSGVLQSLSRGDASAAWCVMIADTAALLAAYLPKEVAQEIYKDPKVITAGIFAPMGRASDAGDQYEVSGQWPWASGSANCTWLSGGAMIMDGDRPLMDQTGKPVQRMMMFHKDDVALLDTWHATGLKGTGSGDMRAENIKIPKSRSVSIVDDEPFVEGLLYKYPIFGLLAVGIASIAIGNARAAIDDLKTHLLGKKLPGAKKSMAEKQLSLLEVGKLEASYSSIQISLEALLQKSWQKLEEGDDLSPQDRADIRLACVHAVRQCSEICRVAYDFAGGSSVFLSSPLQRRFRDAHVMTQHIMVSQTIYELAGRVKLGLETDVTML